MAQDGEVHILIQEKYITKIWQAWDAYRELLYVVNALTEMVSKESKINGLVVLRYSTFKYLFECMQMVLW